tara:strand:+ start:145 stop:351 length:207 start_codon:yes stop_codon:yes gene_type:complete
MTQLITEVQIFIDNIDVENVVKRVYGEEIRLTEQQISSVLEIVRDDNLVGDYLDEILEQPIADLIEEE